MTRAKKYVISGRVQGVGFRFFAECEANRLGIRGYVRNLSDGSVEVYAAGTPDALRALSALLAEGPRAAEVAGVEESDQPVNHAYRSFLVEA
ncbi:MAG: acylphosphatase [Terriglobia bacterium]